MSAPQNFRSAFNGFNREDVVRYLEYLNSRHASQVSQLTSEADFLRSKLDTAQVDLDVLQERDELLARVAELEARCVQLETQLSENATMPVAYVAQQVPEQMAEQMPELEPEVKPEPQQKVELKPEKPTIPTASEELEAYRRAERTERMAKERAELVYHQVNGVLAEATSKVDGAAAEIGTMADQVMQQLLQLQVAVAGSKDIFCDAASTINAIKPNK
jgi:hypothetical protein